MNQIIDFEKPLKIYYHSDIILESHRENCITCDTAFFLIKDLVKQSGEEKK